MEIIKTSKIPKSNGHYSQCIHYNVVLYLSGQLPIDPVSKAIPETIEEQTDLALQNVELILNVAGSSKKQVLQIRVYISDIALGDKVNERYSIFLKTINQLEALFLQEIYIWDVLLKLKQQQYLHNKLSHAERTTF